MLALLRRYGSWGVCFTYGTWFGIEALAAVGEDVHSSAVSALRALSQPLCPERNDVRMHVCAGAAPQSFRMLAKVTFGFQT